MKHPWQRIGAYLIDYGMILLWMAALFGAANLGWLAIEIPDAFTTKARWLAQGQAFLMLTLPVYLYFTISEMFVRQATLGKRVLQLRFKGRPAQIILRNMLKFAPWEVTHTGIWHGMNVPFGSAPTPLGWTLFAVSMGLSFLYFISLFVRNGHPPYDGLAGTQVARVLADNDP